jgi:hypothetical protein
MNYLAGVAVAELTERRQLDPSGAPLTAARDFFSMASAGRPELPNAAARLAAMELQRGGRPSAETRAAAERAHAQAPGRHEYTFLLAQVLAMQSEFEAARSLLGPMLTPAYPANVRESARRYLGFISSIEASGAARSARPTGGLSLNTTVTTIRDEPEPVTRPVFRDLKPGEQRFEGTLERIECAAGGSAVFHVKSGADLVTAAAPKMADVEFITYRTDLKGNVSCGPLSPALPVYVTWRPGVAEGSKVAIAIEFLPRVSRIQ